MRQWRASPTLNRLRQIPTPLLHLKTKFKKTIIATYRAQQLFPSYRSKQNEFFVQRSQKRYLSVIKIGYPLTLPQLEIERDTTLALDALDFACRFESIQLVSMWLNPLVESAFCHLVLLTYVSCAQQKACDGFLPTFRLEVVHQISQKSPPGTHRHENKRTLSHPSLELLSKYGIKHMMFFCSLQP